VSDPRPAIVSGSDSRPSDSIEGLSALVVGASRGIGEATARLLAAAGARVYLAARSMERLEKIAGEIGGVPLSLDLEDADAVGASIQGLVSELGAAPDIVVNAAGVFSMTPTVDTPVETFGQALAVNLAGPFAVIRALLPAMIARGSGSVVTVGSVAGRKAYPGNAAYSSAKFGLRGLHEVLREELRGTGVRCSLIEPAATDTHLWDDLDPDSDPNLPDRSQMLRPEDVAESILFVCTRPDGVQIPVLAIEHD